MVHIKVICTSGLPCVCAVRFAAFVQRGLESGVLGFALPPDAEVGYHTSTTAKPTRAALLYYKWDKRHQNHGDVHY